jgi:glycosyltransferase involved in cell wall biosynthesis
VTRVLHVQKVSGISGSEAHLLSVLPLLRRRGWDARMVVLDEGEDGATRFAEELRARDVPTTRLRMRLDADPLLFARLAATIRRARPEVVHTHLVHADLLGLPAATLARVPVRISTKHGFNAFRLRRGFGAADRGVGRLADVDVAISRGLAEHLAAAEGFDADAFEIVHYGIAPGPEAPPPPRGPRLLAVGRLIEIKGLDTLLRALAAARADVPAMTLDLAGSGPVERDLRHLAAQLGLEDAVRFLGHVSPVAPLLEEALAVVVPSRGEGFGMVALEAMERSRAVVASAVGGLPELVFEGESGLLVPPDDVEALRVALVRVATDPDATAAMGAAGRRRALEEFPVERPAERLDAIYRAALARRNRSTAAPASTASSTSHGTR